MTEKDPLNVFVCGNYKQATPEEQGILKLIEDVVKGNGDVVINESLLRSEADPMSSVQRARMVSAYRSAMIQADCGYADITVPRLSQAEPIRILQNLFNVPVWTSAKANSNGDTSDLMKVARYPRKEGWQRPVDVADYVRTCLSMGRNIRVGRRNRTLAELHFADIPGIDNPENYDPTTEVIVINGIEYQLVPYVREQPQDSNLIRTGAVSIDLTRKRILHKEKQVAMRSGEYYIAEFLGNNMEEFVDEEAIMADHRARFVDQEISEKLFYSHCWEAVRKLNICSPEQGKLVEHFRHKYKLNYFPLDFVPLPRMEQNGKLEVDFTNSMAWLDNEDLGLTQLGTNTVLFLMERIGQSISRDKLCEVGWPGTPPDKSKYSALIKRLVERLGNAALDTNGLILFEKNKGVTLVDKRSD